MIVIKKVRMYATMVSCRYGFMSTPQGLRNKTRSSSLVLPAEIELIMAGHTMQMNRLETLQKMR